MRAPHDTALTLIARALAHTYDLGAAPEMGAYLLDARMAAALGLDVRGAPEQIFVVEHEDALPELGLYLSDDVLSALGSAHRATSVADLLAHVPLAPLMYATEGVSHVLWLEASRRFGAQVRQLELELQAEIDKFVIALCGSEGPSGLSPSATRSLLQYLFVTPELAETLSAAERARYRAASQAAEFFLRATTHNAAWRLKSHSLLPQLRRFCRQPLSTKLRA